MRGARRALSAASALDLLSQVATLAFLGLQIALFLIRRLPEAKAEGFRPRLAALIGSNLQIAFLALPRVSASLPVTVISFALVIVGTGGAIYAAAWLGRFFSIFPQARRLVLSGPYRHLRHPLYLAEMTATAGAMLQFAMPWSLAIALASFVAQFPRMHYEERVLAETYPDYNDHAARTWRLIPCIY